MKKPLADNIVKVSIVIVTYNAEKYLQECINSILAQPFTDYEIVIMDGASTDNTVDIIKQYGDKIAFWKSEKDNGIYNAMNKVLKFCKGEWIYFLGSDDVVMNGFSEMAQKLSLPNTIYYGDCITSDPDVFLGGKYDNYRLAKMNICHHAIFYHRTVFDSYKYEEKYIVAADHVLNMKCWNDRRFNWLYFPITTARYRLNGFSATVKDMEFKKDRATLVRKYLGFFIYLRFRLKQYKTRKNPRSYVN